MFCCLFYIANEVAIYHIYINCRGVASLTGLVCIKPDYPMSWPVFCLSLQWKDKWTAANNEWIR